MPASTQLAYGQNILDEIGQTFNNMTSGLLGIGNGNGTENTNDSTTSTNSYSTTPTITPSSTGSINQSMSSSPSSSSANTSNSPSSPSASPASSNASTSNQSSQGIGSIEELQNLTSGNQELLENNTSIGAENSSLGQDLEKEQFVESENISNTAVGNSTNSK